MTDFVIPCSTFARLSNVVINKVADCHASFQTIRIDNNQVVATDRHFMAIENIPGNAGVCHILPDAALIAQCHTEAAYNSKLTITVNEALRFAVAKTTMGYVTQTNVGYFGEIDAAWNRWREVVLMAAEPAKKPKGAMFWMVDNIAHLVNSSRSGRVVFEEIVDCDRPTLIRDIYDGDWLGVFNPHCVKQNYSPATMPGWMK